MKKTIKNITVIIGYLSFSLYLSASMRQVGSLINRLPSTATIYRLSKQPLLKATRPSFQKVPRPQKQLVCRTTNEFDRAVAIPLLIDAFIYWGIKTILPFYFVPKTTYKVCIEKVGDHLATTNNQFD